MKLAKGLKFRDVEEGSGRKAVPGDIVILDHECRLNRGELLFDSSEDGAHQMKIGERNTFLGIEQGAIGMRAGGIRDVSVPPQLTYTERNVFPDLPDNAMLRYTLSVHEILDEWDNRWQVRYLKPNHDTP